MNSVLNQRLTLADKIRNWKWRIHLWVQNKKKEWSSCEINHCQLCKVKYGAQLGKNNLTGLKSALSKQESQFGVGRFPDKAGEVEKPIWTWNNHSYYPMHYAAAHGQAEMVQLLIEKGIDINSYCYFGEDWQHSITALHWAVLDEKRETVQTLLDLGANIQLHGHCYHFSGTSLDFARRAGNKAIIGLLEAAHTRQQNGGILGKVL